MVIPRWRYLGGAVGLLIFLHLLLSIHAPYREKTAPGWLSWGGNSGVPEGSWSGSRPPSPSLAPQLPSIDDLKLAKDTEDVNERRRANATFVVLARNQDLGEILSSMRQMEDRFNFWAKYDWVFLNDNEFSDDFKKWTQSITPSKCIYGKIDPKEWNQPDWIDEDKARASRMDMIRKKVIYGHSVPYRNMCRFNSGFFYRHPLLMNYDYYWRVEPGVRFFCDITYDPFLYMQDNDKTYGFTLSMYEYLETIPSLWEATRNFTDANPQYIAPDNSVPFISDDQGRSYNLCHFWSNFEIGDLRFWRGEAYTKYFEHLESLGGFYYERWGDAPVHSIAAALFLPRDKLHWFDDIGYRHEPFQHCPTGAAHTRGKCWCDPADTFDWHPYSCTARFINMFKK